MPNKGKMTKQGASSSRRNGQKASRTHTLRAAERRFGSLSAKEQDLVLTAAERYAKARADKEESVAGLRRQEYRLRAGQLLEASEVRESYLKLAAGIRREINAIPSMIEGITLSNNPADPIRKMITALQERLRAVLSNPKALRMSETPHA